MALERLGDAVDVLPTMARGRRRTAWFSAGSTVSLAPEQVELERLRRRNERLEAELARTKTALETTGKVHALLEQLSKSAAPENKSTP